MTLSQCPRCQFREGCWFSSVDELLAVDHHVVQREGKVHESKSCPFFEPDRYLLAGGPIE